MRSEGKGVCVCVLWGEVCVLRGKVCVCVCVCVCVLRGRCVLRGDGAGVEGYVGSMWWGSVE